MNNILTSMMFLLLTSLICVGQTSYKGLTPGQSTRADVERVLGQPVKEVSKTLVEYRSPENAVKLFVQYRAESPAAIAERIEQTCVSASCRSALEEYSRRGAVALPDVIVLKQNAGAGLYVDYYGAPRFIVSTLINKTGSATDFESRVAFYSKELYESVVPKGGCTGTIFGTWQTDRGRVTMWRVGDNGIRGTYSKNNGTFNLKRERDDFETGAYVGEWKDDTGSGTMALLLESSVYGANPDSFNATWAGPGASVPSNKQAKELAKTEVEKEAERLGAELEKLSKVTVAAGATNREPSLREKGLPPGQPWKGKCVP